MKKYKISIGGRGAELAVFELNNEQYEELEEGNVQHDEMEYEDICDILGVEAYFDSPNPYIIGVYEESFYMKVIDEEGNVIHTIEELDSDNYKLEGIYSDGNKYLIIEDSCKGEHITYNLELEEDFDINKVKYINTEVGDRIELITGITYDGKSCEDYKEYGGTNGKEIGRAHV